MIITGNSGNKKFDLLEWAEKRKYVAVYYGIVSKKSASAAQYETIIYIHNCTLRHRCMKGNLQLNFGCYPHNKFSQSHFLAAKVVIILGNL